MSSCCQTRTMERKSQLKTIKVRLFSVSLIFILVFPHLWRFLRRGTGERTSLWGLAGGRSVLHPATCDLLRLSGAVDRIRPVERGRAHNSGLLTDMMEWFWRAIMDFGPPLPCPPYEVLKPFLMDSPALAPALLCVSFPFINVSFFLSDFPLWIRFSFLLHFCFWCGLDCACFVFWSQCLQVEFEPSSSPQFWSDGVCVFIKSLLLLNVQRV